MSRFYIIIAILQFSLFVYSQNSIRTTGMAQVELTKEKNRLEVEKEARDIAIINALERAFGRVVIQGNATYVSNLNTGEKTETRSIFNMIANTSVNGIVEKIINENFSDVVGYKYVDGEKTEAVEIKCEVTIQAIEIKTPPIEYKAFPMACLNINCKKSKFMNNDNLFFYFISPVSGYLSIYLDDGVNASRLLPYRNMPETYESGVPVKADSEYFFFSDERDNIYFDIPSECIDKYQVFTKKQVEEMNRIFVIFSKEPMNKPSLNSNLENEYLTKMEIELGYMMPQGLSSEDFQRWLSTNRSYRKDQMQVNIIDITISEK